MWGAPLASEIAGGLSLRTESNGQRSGDRGEESVRLKGACEGCDVIRWEDAEADSVAHSGGAVGCLAGR